MHDDAGQDRRLPHGGSYVRFVVRLQHAARADMFRDHVGHVKLYVYDETGPQGCRKVGEQRRCECAAARLRLFRPFSILGACPRALRLQAIGMQKDLGRRSRHRRRQIPPRGRRQPHRPQDSPRPCCRSSCRHQLSSVEHRSVAPRYPLAYSQGDELRAARRSRNPLRSMPQRRLTVPIPRRSSMSLSPADMPPMPTVSLVRDTKHLNITLRQIDEPDKITHNDFDVDIIEPNGTIGTTTASPPATAFSTLPTPAGRAASTTAASP